jgi:5'-methylthioadenosine phosphorylase
MNKIGIIGGSGIYNFPEIKLIEEVQLMTPYGHPSSKIKKFNFDGVEFYFLARHGEGHAISPSEINYRANIFALKSLGVDILVSVSAVGSLKEELSPGSVFLPDQFIDWTKGKRARTFFDEGVVGHVSTANPVDKNLYQVLKKACEASKVKYAFGGSYICIEGPQFSTRAESSIYRSFGCSVIGMTNVPEAYLAKEAGMAYATLALVTDYDCWKEEHCTLEEIMKIMKGNYESAQTILKNFLNLAKKTEIKVEKENQYAVVTHSEIIPQEKKKILDTLLR